MENVLKESVCEECQKQKRSRDAAMFECLFPSPFTLTLLSICDSPCVLTSALSRTMLNPGKKLLPLLLLESTTSFPVTSEFRLQNSQ